MTTAVAPDACVVHAFPTPDGEVSPRIGERAELPLVLAIATSIVVSTRQGLKQRILDELTEGRREFVFDMSQCGYVDASGLGVLVSIAKKIREREGRFLIAGLNADLVTLFQLTQLDTVLSTVDTVERALATFAGAPT